MLSPRITRKRRLVQWILIAVALILPFVTISGNPFLRMDIPRMTLFLAGVPLRIDQFYLLLLLILLVVALFLLITVVLGRVWCGWLCPQTVFNDLAEQAAGLFRTRVPLPVARLIEHLASLLISALISFNLFCWFMSPLQAAAFLRDFPNHWFVTVTFLVITLSGYLNLVLVRRSFCHSYCPYGRFQAVLMDAGTLNLSFHEETRDRCLRCNACVRVCPMGVDIRAGFQIECINCGRCIDACRSVMEKRPGGAGLIDYRFGLVKGTGFKMGTTTAVLTTVTLLLAIALGWGLASRNQSGFAVQRVATAELRTLPDGSTAQPWRAIIGNRSEAPQRYSIRIAGAAPGVDLIGPVRDIAIEPNQHREVIFMIHQIKGASAPGRITLQLLNGTAPAGDVVIQP